MIRFQAFFLLCVCLLSIGWMWKENSKVQEYMEQGYKAWQAGNLTEAMNYYQEALELEPQHVSALNSLGVVYEGVGLPDKAEEKYLSALTLDDKFLPAYSNLAFLYWNQGNFEKAAHYFQKRVDLGNPRDIWTIKAQRALETIKKNRQSEISREMKQVSQ
jgi:Flp pilus assembly protein TadD